MLAPRTAVPANPRDATPDVSPDERPPLRPASDEDPAAPSPVHGMHADLAKALDRPPARRLDPVKAAGVALMVLYTLGAWWGLFSLASFLARVFTR